MGINQSLRLKFQQVLYYIKYIHNNPRNALFLLNFLKWFIPLCLVSKFASLNRQVHNYKIRGKN